LLLLALSLLLVGCKDRLPAFAVDADGNGYTNEETGVHYVALDFPYEAVGRGEAVGVYDHPKLDYSHVFYAIPDEDPTLFLTDDSMTVWYAGEVAIDAAEWELSAVIVCREDVVSVELFALTVGEEDAAIDEVQALWFSGEEAELPEGSAAVSRTVKLATDAYPGIYYSFYFYWYESGEGYFFAPVSGRCVAVPDNLTEQFLPGEEAEK